MIPLQRNPIGRLDAISTVINHHVFLLDGGHIGTMTSFCRYHHVHWGPGCSRLLAHKQRAGRDDAEYQESTKSQAASVHKFFRRKIGSNATLPAAAAVRTALQSM